MREIGGYFELEELKGSEYYPDLIPLNTGRNALLYICQAKNIQKLYLPYFLCDCISNLCQKNMIELSFYHINAEFMPQIPKKLQNGEVLYLVNYYGQLDHKMIQQLQNLYSRIIVDNTHAFFQSPVLGTDTIYSCRKFFGVPDGAYLKTDQKLKRFLENEKTNENMGHLLGRYEKNASEFYDEYHKSEQRFYNTPIRHMSHISHNILKAIDYDKVYKIRMKNFGYLNRALKKWNSLNIKTPERPFAYPLYHKNGIEIRKYLAERKIYIPVLWPNVLDLKDCFLERDYAANILPIPCDQRYTEDDMKYVVNILYQHL